MLLCKCGMYSCCFIWLVLQYIMNLEWNSEESDPNDSIDNSLASFQDQMYYLQDVLSMEMSQVATSLALFFVAHFVYPVLLKPLISRKLRV